VDAKQALAYIEDCSDVPRVDRSREVQEWREAWGIARDALRAQVTAEEASKRKRPTLEEIERGVRAAGDFFRAGIPSTRVTPSLCEHGADILKAVREVIVPRLRRAAFERAHVQCISPAESGELLRALGEEP
jgi:hypothetical protein